ncbi:MAG TPA: fumarylacetoacetate hydrolase family protein [Tahibacter sp.]|jgi:fumarylpyruvate hydrolase|nr:fumarylacetoacetate hydrolase family protein [Tahibacter sp.]
MRYVVPASPIPVVPVLGDDALFPVHRIYCVGRNYADHAKEMGAEVNRAKPTFFSKPADAVLTGDADLPYPSATSDLHHEVELVVALHSGGRDIAVDDALAHVYGYAVGLDLTRRDLQAEAKEKRLPWDTGKGFDNSAPISAIRAIGTNAHPHSAQLVLTVNGAERQRTDIDAMIFNVAEIIHELSKLYELKAGDLIYTGTPAGVAALVRGDTYVATLEGIAELRGRVV